MHTWPIKLEQRVVRMRLLIYTYFGDVFYDEPEVLIMSNISVNKSTYRSGHPGTLIYNNERYIMEALAKLSSIAYVHGEL